MFFHQHVTSSCLSVPQDLTVGTFGTSKSYLVQMFLCTMSTTSYASQSLFPSLHLHPAVKCCTVSAQPPTFTTWNYALIRCPGRHLPDIFFIVLFWIVALTVNGPYPSSICYSLSYGAGLCIVRRSRVSTSVASLSSCGQCTFPLEYVKACGS